MLRLGKEATFWDATFWGEDSPQKLAWEASPQKLAPQDLLVSEPTKCTFRSARFHLLREPID